MMTIKFPVFQIPNTIKSVLRGHLWDKEKVTI